MGMKKAPTTFAQQNNPIQIPESVPVYFPEMRRSLAAAIGRVAATIKKIADAYCPEHSHHAKSR